MADQGRGVPGARGTLPPLTLRVRGGMARHGGVALAGKFLQKSQSISMLGVHPCAAGRRRASLKKKKKNKKRVSSPKLSPWRPGQESGSS